MNVDRGGLLSDDKIREIEIEQHLCVLRTRSSTSPCT